MKYEEPYIQIVELQGVIVTLVSGNEDDDVDLGDINISQKSDEFLTCGWKLFPVSLVVSCVMMIVTGLAFCNKNYILKETVAVRWPFFGQENSLIDNSEKRNFNENFLARGKILLFQRIPITINIREIKVKYN